MGNLLASPITEKETHRGETSNGEIQFAVSSMQGWRIHMEDAHICQPHLFAQERLNDSDDVNDSVHDNSTASASSTSDGNSNSNSNSNSNGTTMGGLVKKAKMNINNSDTTTDSHNCTANVGATDNAGTTGDAGTSNSGSNKYTNIELPNHSIFAVFDGHGGSFAAKYCGLNFVRVLSRQPAFVQYAKFAQQLELTSTTTNNDNKNSKNCSSNQQDEAQAHRKGIELLEQAFHDAFLDIDREIWRAVNQLQNKDCILPTRNNNHDNNHNDDHNDNDDSDEYSFSQEDSGTTAVAVMLTPQYIICANAGDSRSVYSKHGNSAIPLSYDHKPDDEAEERRIIDAGGFVRVGRVDGDLAVSRGLGDFRFKHHLLYNSMGTTPIADLPHLHCSSRKDKQQQQSHQQQQQQQQQITTTDTTATTKDSNNDNDDGLTDDSHHNNINSNIMLPGEQKVSPIPDIVVQKRDPELDEFIVLACDGIFDVQSNQECIALTADIFKDGENDLGLVCEEIVDECLVKGSKDNMTAMVIKFPAQKVGEGGGVAKRREERQLQAEATED